MRSTTPLTDTGTEPVPSAVRQKFLGGRLYRTYAHLEYNENPKFGSSADEPFFTLGQGDYTPERYADVAVGWKEMGGCCATTPDHIRAVRAAVKP